MLAKMVEERIDTLDNHITWTHIAKKLNLSKGAISKFKNNISELGFLSAFEMCEMLHPSNYIEVMSTWCFYFRKPENVKFALEFLQMNRFKNTLTKYLAILEKEATSPTIPELIEVYSSLINGNPTIDAQNKPKLKEVAFLRKMNDLYRTYNNSPALSDIIADLSEAEELIKEVSDADLRERYELRVYEIKAVISLFKENDPSKSRTYSEEILRKIHYMCDKLAADSYYRMGMSFLNESPDMCLHFLKKSADTLDKAGFSKEAKNVRDTEIEFVKVHWGLIKSEEEISNPESKAHFHAINNESEKASEYISTLNQESPFTLYYKGAADSNAAFLIESALIFKNRANRFYAELPLRLLENMPGMTGIVMQIRQ